MFGDRKKPKVDDEVDITPMIDITFLMLIFFMVTSTPDKNSEIKLAEALHGDAVSQRDSTVITIAFAGFDQSPVYAADGVVPGAVLSEDFDTQTKQITDEVSKGLSDGKSNVIIKADRAVAYRHVDRVIKSISVTPGVQLYLAVLENQ